MNIKEAIEAAILVSLSAVLYWFGFELQGWLFQFTEHIPGVNWFYMPSGLRVVLVLVAGAYGAMGIFFATLLINFLYMQDITGALMLLTAVASGSGAWVALNLLRWKGLIAEGLSGFTVAALLQFSLLYAVLNALFHQSVWWTLKREGSLFAVDIWPMFIGDLLGALVFLYGIKWVFRIRQRAPQFP